MRTKEKQERKCCTRSCYQHISLLLILDATKAHVQNYELEVMCSVGYS